MTQKGFALAVVAAQALAQIGAFALAALLPLSRHARYLHHKLRLIW